MVSNLQDAIHINLDNSDETDLDEIYHIQDIKEIKYDEEDKEFYVLANKQFEKLGFFLLKFNAFNPNEGKYLARWKNKLDIGDTNICVIRNEKTGYRELVIAYKTIFINTYNVMVLDMLSDKNSMLFRHESFQLWESACTSTLPNHSQDFLIVNRDGIQVLSLGQVDKKRIIDSEQNERIIHSLESVSFLKL